MIETQLNAFDATVIVIMVLSCLVAFFRGFVKEILSLGAWIGAGLVTVYYFPAVAEKLQPHFKSTTVAAGFGTLGIYVTALICFSLLNMLILRFLKEGSDVGMLDNMLGLLFGAFRGALIVALGFFIMTIFMPDADEYPEWVKEAKTREYVEHAAVLLTSVAPEYLREITSLKDKAEAMRQERGDLEPASGETSRNLKRMIEETEPSK